MGVKGVRPQIGYPCSMDEKWLPRINRQLCTGCGECIARCPEQALAQVDGKAALAYPERCTYCRACEELCPEGAIDLPFLICFGKTADSSPRDAA